MERRHEGGMGWFHVESAMEGSHGDRRDELGCRTLTTSIMPLSKQPPPWFGRVSRCSSARSSTKVRRTAGGDVDTFVLKASVAATSD